MLRRFLGAIFVFGGIGLAAELLLVGHVEDPWQLTPLVLIACGLGALAWDAVSPSTWSLTLCRVCAALLIAGGVVGLGLHYRSNVEFELEMYPDLQGFPLVREALTGAVPALAPGALIQLGLVGLAYTYREKL